MKSFVAPIVLGLALACPLASAAYTNVNAPLVPEQSHEAILEALYGVDFTLQGVDFVSPSVQVIRVADSGGLSPLSLNSPNLAIQDDTCDVEYGPLVATARARYAGDYQYFGYVPGESDGNPVDNADFVPVMSVSGSGYAVHGEWTGEIDGIFRWARRTSPGGLNLFTSDPSDNIGADDLGHDQLVTYLVQGAPNTTGVTWLLFWEDRITGQDRADYDFNDAVIEINVAPEPSALGLAASLVLLFLRRGR